jgi:hypothetical protein
MMHWLQNIDIAALVSTLAVMICCTALGSIIGGRCRFLPASDLVVGLGLAGGVLTLWTGPLAIRISAGLAAVAAAGTLIVPVLIRRRILPGGLSFWLALVAVGLVMVAAASVSATMWDDFYHWLPNAAYQYRYDFLFHNGAPKPLAKWPGYPQTMPFIINAASLLAGRFLESAGPITNTALIAAFVAALADVNRGYGSTAITATLARHISLISFAVIVAVLVNPAFNSDLVLSSYADIGTQVAVAFCGMVGCQVLQLVTEEDNTSANAMALRFGLIAVCLINLKQANAVLFVLIMTGLALASWRTVRIERKLIPIIAFIVMPPLAVFLFWRWYVLGQVLNGEMSFRAISAWNWPQIPDTLYIIARYLFTENPAFAILMTSVTGLGLASLLKQPGNVRPGEQLLVVTTVCWIGYNLFLMLVYLGAMTEEEASNAADYWRYAPHVGYIGVSAIVTYFATSSGMRHLITWLKSAMIVVMPMVLLSAYFIIHPSLAKPYSLHFRAVGRDLADMLPANTRVVVMSGYRLSPMSDAIRYDLWRPGRDDRGLQTVWEGEEPTDVLRPFSQARATHLLISGTIYHYANISSAIGLREIDQETVLFKWENGSWKEVAAWPFREEK